MATLIDNGVEKGDMQVVVCTSLIMLVVVLCGLTVGCLGSVFGSKAAAGFARNLRQDQYDVTGGSVTGGGIDVRDYDLDTLRDQVSVVLQKNVLFSGHHRLQPALGRSGRHR